MSPASRCDHPPLVSLVARLCTFVRKHTGGRPPIQPGEASVLVTTRVLERQRAELAELAEREGVGLAEIVRRAVARFLAEQQEAAA